MFDLFFQVDESRSGLTIDEGWVGINQVRAIEKKKTRFKKHVLQY
jgi:hypothetical protein